MERLLPRDIAGFANISELFEALKEELGENQAIIQEGKSHSYADLWELSSRLGGYLQSDCGIGEGDRVAVMLPNMPAFPVACLAIMRIGAVQVNINPLYVARELRHQLVDSDARAIIIHFSALPTLVEANPPALRNIVVIGAAPAKPLMDGGLRWPAAQWDDVLAGKLTIAPRRAARTDLAFLQYTGGTTGRAKGAMLSHGNILANVEQFLKWTDGYLQWAHVAALTAIPLYHIFALTVNMFAVAALGGVNVLVRDPRNVVLLCEEWERHRINFFTGVNTLFKTLGRSEHFASIEFAPDLITMGGGAAVQRSVSDRWRELTGRHIIEGYGLSETSPVLSCTPFGEMGFLGSIGFAFPDTVLAIRDDDGIDAAPGQVGELCARGPQVMLGYWRQQEATAASMTSDGFFRTGDLARRDDDGRYYIVDRRKDMILVSGFNVYPNEIEEVGATLAGVAECACVGVPDARTGEAVALFVVASDPLMDPDRVIAHCRANLASYKVPRHVVFIDAVPKSAVGKILRRELRELAVPKLRLPGAAINDNPL
jgi:long-chain acyl-CoA synthetase